MRIDDLIDILHNEDCSCVIYSHGKTTLCRERGVRDLFHIHNTIPETLAGSMIADKVVGKGAAALMISGGARCVYADVISEPALYMLTDASVAVSYGECVPNIINRAGTGICPVEALCRDCTTADDCLPLIADFVKTLDSRQGNDIINMNRPGSLSTIL